MRALAAGLSMGLAAGLRGDLMAAGTGAWRWRSRRMRCGWAHAAKRWKVRVAGWRVPRRR